MGEENHSPLGTIHRVGIFVDGRFSWLYEEGWNHKIKYHPDTLIGDCFAQNEALKVKIYFEDFVYTTHDILVRKVTIENQADHERKIKIFFAHDFYIYGEKIQDTAQYEPELNALLHYRKKRYFLMNGKWDNTGKGIAQYSVGKSSYGHREGTWRDAEDGDLQGHPIEQGSVDSVAGFEENFLPKEAKILWTWVSAGKNYHQVCKNDKRIQKLGPQTVYNHTFDYWYEWTNKTNYQSKENNDLNDNEIIELFKRSLLIIRSQIDNRGAIIAANDSDIMKFNKDSYSYMWPRDGAFVAMALANAGYLEVVRDYFFFCEKLITDGGYMLKKYTPNGTLGSSWLPLIKNGESQLPIQEDESALTLVALEKFYRCSKCIETIQDLFNHMILPIGDFLIKYTDKPTGLPLPSYDLWEEQRGVFSYTAACVYAGLKSAAYLSKHTGHYKSEKKYLAAAKKVQKAILEYLYSKKEKRFLKSVQVKNGNVYGQDETVDGSLSLIWEMGVLSPDDPRIVSTMQAIEKNLTVKTEVGGIARYSEDDYHKDINFDYSKEDVSGNPWIITTLWLANWYIETAKTKKDLERVEKILEWITERTNSAGILPEQVDPFTGAPLSVAPLTWSHSTFVDTVLRYWEKSEQLN